MTSADPATAKPDDALSRRRPPTIATLWVAGSVLLCVLYAFVFVGTRNEGIGAALVHATANVLPISLLAIAVRALLKAEVMRRSTAVQCAWHLVLAVAFAFIWYATLVMLLALINDLQGRGFALSGFSGPALTWQVFQGLILYAAITGVCYAVRGGREAAQVSIVTAPPTRPPLARYLIRTGEEMTRVEVDEIITLTGAQDYTEVATPRGRHLVRLSLGEFQARLDADRFVRVHRSTIINLSRLDRTEPAGGGRLLAHMTDGQIVQVSRTGAQSLRQFMV